MTEVIPPRLESLAVLLKLEDFEAWLQGQPADRKLAESHHCKRCPIAVFLGAQHGCLAVHVAAFTFKVTHQGHCYGMQPLPRWCRDFIRVLDANNYKALDSKGLRSTGVPVTAARCLATLAWLKTYGWKETQDANPT